MGAGMGAVAFGAFGIEPPSAGVSWSLDSRGCLLMPCRSMACDG